MHGLLANLTTLLANSVLLLANFGFASNLRQVYVNIALFTLACGQSGFLLPVHTELRGNGRRHTASGHHTVQRKAGIFN
ncbi:hypothetical protein [Peribacillus muralis]|uniref:hypothetical protein n=1 Tax=Peribacillus muralis TaxID=264697 RepID=UPI003D034663